MHKTIHGCDWDKILDRALNRKNFINFFYKLEIVVICSSNILKNGWMYGYWLWWIVLDQCDKYRFFMFINLMHLKNCWIKSEFLAGFKIKRYIMELVFIRCNSVY